MVLNLDPIVLKLLTLGVEVQMLLVDSYDVSQFEDSLLEPYLYR